MTKSFYVEGNSIIHRLHPSTKLTLYGIFFLITNLVSWPWRWAIAGALLVFLWLCGISPWKYRLLFFINAIAAITVPLFNGLWASSQDPLILPISGSFGFHHHGLEAGLAFAGLYSAAAMETIAFLVSTKLWQLAEAPTLLGAPHVVGFTMAYGFWYMPEVVQHLADLSDVWRTRGVNFDQGPIWERFWLQCRLLTSLILLEFSRVRAKSNAVESRGFSLKTRGTLYLLPPIPTSEKILILAAAVLASTMLAMRLIALITGG